jgi:ABC-type transporter Mla MlaB component
MLKITTTVSEHGALTIGIAGRLTPDGCEAVDEVLKDARKQRREVKIDLAGIGLVDQRSVEYLAHIQSLAIELLNVPSYVSRWIEQVSKQHEFGKQRGQFS